MCTGKNILSLLTMDVHRKKQLKSIYRLMWVLYEANRKKQLKSYQLASVSHDVRVYRKKKHLKPSHDGCAQEKTT